MELVADVLAFVARWASHPIFKRLCPFRAYALRLDLLAATFGRVKGVPEPLEAQFDARLRTSMGEPRLD